LNSIKPIAIKNKGPSNFIYFTHYQQAKGSQLFLAEVNQQKIKTLAVYEETNQRFEDVTILFTEEYLEELLDDLNKGMNNKKNNFIKVQKTSPSLNFKLFN